MENEFCIFWIYINLHEFTTCYYFEDPRSLVCCFHVVVGSRTWPLGRSRYSRATWSVPRRSCRRDRHRSPESHLGSTRLARAPGNMMKSKWPVEHNKFNWLVFSWKDLLEGNVENGLWLNKICWRYSFEYLFPVARQSQSSDCSNIQS